MRVLGRCARLALDGPRAPRPAPAVRLPVVALALSAIAGAAPCTFPAAGETPTLDLVTIAPADDLFGSMGHTALVFSGGGLEAPVAFDWGSFDDRQPGLLATFLAGELPYFLRGEPLSALVSRTEGQERLSIAQRISAPPEAVRALYARTREEALPENRSYTYHWADANCSTRARDALDDATAGAVRDALAQPVGTTPRFEATRHLWRWPVLGFAWRFITSRRLDTPLTAWERGMVPERLMEDLDDTPLVLARCTLTEGRHGWAPPTPPPGWPWSLPGMLGASAVLATAARKRTRWVGGLVAVCGAVLSAIGIPSFALWVISDLDGIGPTENWLVAGPQSLILVVAGIQLARERLTAGLEVAMIAVGALGAGVFVLDVLPGAQRNGDIVAALLPALWACIVATVWARRA